MEKKKIGYAGVAQALLHLLEADLRAAGVEYEWVEHGTANPTARGFWNKYFETVEYEFIREIKVCRENGDMARG